MSQRITKAVETYGLLLEGQMGNQRERSIELAVRLLTDNIRIV